MKDAKKKQLLLQILHDAQLNLPAFFLIIIIVPVTTFCFLKLKNLFGLLLYATLYSIFCM